ncbi:tenascin-like [Mytilus edulis]|uniref:tenascin-like n=1 Tax=Mytilus edulis TaxID=6550 RepID=UPI0039F0D3B7
MSKNVYLCIKLILSFMLYEPCEAAVENIPCTASNSSSCEAYGNAFCDTTTCRCRDDHYDSGTACYQKKESGATCTQPNQQTECVPNAECQGGVCTCNTGYYDDNFSTTGGQCVSELESGLACTLSNLPTECILNSVCKSNGNLGLQCTCNSGYYDSNFGTTGGSCEQELQTGVTCTQSNQPIECVPNAVCENKGSGQKCYCTSDYYDSNGINPGGTCSSKADVGVACDPIQIGECNDPHSSCVPADVGNKCLCNVGYYDNSGTCTIQVLLEIPCTANRPDNQCIDENAECKDSTGLKCLCKDIFYKDKDGICKQKVALNATCSAGQPSDQCVDLKSECTSSLRCYCQNGYFENSGHVCTIKVVLNDVCNSGQSNYQCEDMSSECKTETGTATNKCLCKNNFYANTTNVCTTKSALGEVCSNGQPTNQCSVANSECIAEATNSLVYRCFCKTNYYKDVQTCKDLSGLRVQNLKVPRDTTGEVYFKITWTIPNNVAFINKYQIKITLNNGNAENFIDIVKTENQYNMTNRQPGHTYVVEVLSVETLSRPRAQTTSVILIAGTRPAVPSAIIKNDILGPLITVSWTVGGIIQHLSGTINGSSVTPKAFNITNIPTSQIPSQSFNSMTNGERYVITVKAYSNGFTSAKFTETIRTTSTQPNPPVINTCDNQDLYDNHMDLRWKKTPVPNGDISHYIIYMSSAAIRTIITDTSTEVQRIEDLLPQRQYCFQLETVNDAVSPESNKSPRSLQVCCVTRASVARLPQNVTLIDVKSRSIKLSWMTPIDIKGVLNGYRVSLRKEGECKVEVLYQCTDCVGAQKIGHKTCDVKKRVNINSADANSMVVTTIDGLFPYISYELWIAAVNGHGDGEKNETIVMTDSEVPEMPGNVVTKVQGPTAIQVSWTKAVVEPGNTTYRIKVYEVVFDTNTYVKDMTVNGYDTESVDVSGLEEYWYYKFTVTASTIKGYATSKMTVVVKTNQAPPGLVQNLIVYRPQHSNNYTQMDVKWNIPQLRDRNSEIKEYILKHNISGIMKEETPRLTADTENLIKSLYVGTEQLYKIEVTAVNTILQVGQTNSIIYFAQPGPPITPTFHPVITDVSKAVTSQRTISVEMNGDWFFYNKDNGVFTDWGVIVCTGDKCDNYGDGTEIKHTFRFGTLHTWKESEKTGFVEPYRATNSKWIVDIYNAAVGLRKRSSHEVEFMLGEDNDCSKREDTVYCNGPLAPGKSYIMVAFTCTNGGCTESKPYGPITTQTAQLPEKLYTIEAVVGAAVGCVLFTVLVMTLIFYLIMRRMRIKTLNSSKPRHPHEEQQFGDQYEDLGMDNISSYQELGAKDIPNVYDQIGRVHTIDKHYENMLS